MTTPVTSSRLPGGADRTAGSILDLTNDCIAKFNQIVNSQDPVPKTALENRLADFNLWVDSVRVTAQPGPSLDSRLKGRPGDISLVKSILLMLSDSLDYYATVYRTSTDSDKGIQNIDSAIKNLALIGVAIRRTGRASRNRRADRTFDPDKHQELRKHLECIILRRPNEGEFHPDNLLYSEPGRSVLSNIRRRLVDENLDPSKLSDIQRRLIDANLRRRHHFVLAQKRYKATKTQTRDSAPTTPMPVDDFPLGEGTPLVNARSPSARQDLPSVSAKQKKQLPARTVAGLTKASTLEGTLKYTEPAKRPTPGAAKTQITSIAANVEFPEPPTIPSDREIYNCPCCCQSLPVETFRDRKLWE